MIICTKCSHHNEDSDEFCGSCGEFLEWTGEKIPEPEPVTAMAAEPPAPLAAESAAPVAAEPARAVPSEPAPKTTEAASEPITAPSPAPPAAGERPAAAAPPPGAQPAAVLPSRTEVRPSVRPVSRPEPAIAPGDLICGSCGAGNKPDRRFCRRCGVSLADAVAAPTARVPWWRRLFSRKPKVHAAGERPMRGGGVGVAGRRRLGLSRLRQPLALVIMAAVLLGVAGPWRNSIRRAISDVRKNVAPRYQSVNPESAAATSAAAGHDAAQGIDAGSDTWWAEGAPGNGEGQAITVTFDPPADLAKVGFSIGAAGEEFLNHPRPREVHLIFSDRSGGSEVLRATKDLTLKDSPKFQTSGVDAKDVTTLQIQIRSVHQGQGGSASGFTDIQFFRKS